VGISSTQPNWQLHIRLDRQDGAVTGQRLEAGSRRHILRGLLVALQTHMKGTAQGRAGAACRERPAGNDGLIETVQRQTRRC